MKLKCYPHRSILYTKYKTDFNPAIPVVGWIFFSKKISQDKIVSYQKMPELMEGCWRIEMMEFPDKNSIPQCLECFCPSPVRILCEMKKWKGWRRAWLHQNKILFLLPIRLPHAYGPSVVVLVIIMLLAVLEPFFSLILLFIPILSHKTRGEGKTWSYDYRWKTEEKWSMLMMMMVMIIKNSSNQVWYQHQKIAWIGNHPNIL